MGPKTIKQNHHGGGTVWTTFTLPGSVGDQTNNRPSEHVRLFGSPPARAENRLETGLFRESRIPGKNNKSDTLAAGSSPSRGLGRLFLSFPIRWGH
jgi:hypothetical protein